MPRLSSITTLTTVPAAADTLIGVTAAGNDVRWPYSSLLVPNLETLKLGHVNRKLAIAEFSSDWTITAGGGNNTISTSADLTNGYYAGGDIIELKAQDIFTTTPPNSNKIVNTPPVPWPVVGANASFYNTIELSVSSGTFATVTLDDGSSNLVYAQFGLNDNQVKIAALGGATIGPVTVPGFDQSQWFRYTNVIIPANVTQGSIYNFLHYTSTTTKTEAQYYIGSTTYSTNLIPSHFTVMNGTISATGTTLVTKMRSYELLGVITGNSVDAGYGEWAPDPWVIRNSLSSNGTTWLAQTVYNHKCDPGYLLGQQFNGDGDWFLTHARGGFDLESMNAGFYDWATQLQPKVIVVGNAGNDAEGMVNNPAYMASEQATYLQMVNKSLAIGAVTICMAMTPRVAITVTQAQLNAVDLQWNAWMQATLPPLGALVCNVYSQLENPAVPGTLLPAYDSGDGTHLSWAGRKLVAAGLYQAAC